MKEEEQIENERVKRRNPATEEKIKKTTGNKKRKQETKDNERRGKDREWKSKAEEPVNRGKDHVKYTIPETLHFLRFPKLMYYQMGVHPPPIQKLSHGDHWRSSFSPSIPWFYHEISISFPNLFVHFSLGFISLPHILAHLITDFIGFLHFFLLSVNFIMFPSYCNVCIMHYLYLIYL